MIKTTCKIYALLSISLLLTGCAINYKPTQYFGVNRSKEKVVNDTISTITIENKTDSSFLNRNKKIKNQLLKKGYRSFIVTVNNHTDDTLIISEKTLFAIKDYETIPIVPKYRVIGLINFNRGLFVAATAYGLISPFGYAGRKVIFNKKMALIALPVLAYGTLNTIIAYRSVNNLTKDISAYYLLGKKIMPKTVISGIVVVKSADNDLAFIYRKLPVP